MRAYLKLLLATTIVVTDTNATNELSDPELAYNKPEDHGKSMEELSDIKLEYEGELEGFDMDEYMDQYMGDSDLFQSFARNYRYEYRECLHILTLCTSSERRMGNYKLRNMRNEMKPIDFTALQVDSMDMMASTRKFKHVAGLIMFKQAVPILGKYVFYGCYCFSDAQYELDAGKGRPVDAIDSACKSFHQCYRCVNKDFVQEAGQENCDGSNRSYRFKGVVDEVTGKKEIVCLNNKGSCKRGICECDKALAEDLSDLEVCNKLINTNHYLLLNSSNGIL